MRLLGFSALTGEGVYLPVFPTLELICLSQGLPEIIQALSMGNYVPWQDLGNNNTR